VIHRSSLGRLTTFGYDAVGNRTRLTQPNGVTTTYTHDARDRLTTIESRTAAGTLLARYAYTLDAAGNRTGVTEHGGRTVTWQYDLLHRLVAETITEPGGTTETESFGQDAVAKVSSRAGAAIRTPPRMRFASRPSDPPTVAAARQLDTRCAT
jgi:YD repeat-containing protein